MKLSVEDIGKYTAIRRACAAVPHDQALSCQDAAARGAVHAESPIALRMHDACAIEPDSGYNRI